MTCKLLPAVVFYHLFQQRIALGHVHGPLVETVRLSLGHGEVHGVHDGADAHALEVSLRAALELLGVVVHAGKDHE